MTDSGDPGALTPSLRAMERAQAISRALTDAARRARFSTRARGAYRSSFAARRGAALMRALTIGLFVALVAVPNIVIDFYLALLASDQYVAEARFTVSSGAIPKMDGLGSVSGLPPMLIVQDIQVVTNYIQSRTMVEELERLVGLRDIYSSPSIDWFARFRKDKPIEKFTRYWEDMSATRIGIPSGIVTLTVRAFTPEDAKRIAEAVIGQSETLINNLNARMRSDTVLASERDMQSAAQRLGHARVQMEYIRNAKGVLNVNETGKALSGLVSGLQSDLLQAERDYQTELRYVAEDAPQMRVMKTRISAMRSQLEDMKAKLTKTENTAAADDEALSGKMTKFDELGLEERIAEKRYAQTVAAVEAARMMSERRMLYLHEIVPPALPEESTYPKRWLIAAMTFLASIVAWTGAVAGLAFARNHMA